MTLRNARRNDKDRNRSVLISWSGRYHVFATVYFFRRPDLIELSLYLRHNWLVMFPQSSKKADFIS